MLWNGEKYILHLRQCESVIESCEILHVVKIFEKEGGR